jgi:hypothetical protein
MQGGWNRHGWSDEVESRYTAAQSYVRPRGAGVQVICNRYIDTRRRVDGRWMQRVTACLRPGCWGDLQCRLTVGWCGILAVPSNPQHDAGLYISGGAVQPPPILSDNRLSMSAVGTDSHGILRHTGTPLLGQGPSCYPAATQLLPSCYPAATQLHQGVRAPCAANAFGACTAPVVGVGRPDAVTHGRTHWRTVRRRGDV